MSNVPAGFTKVGTEGGLVFQSASKWKQAGETGRMVQGIYEGLTEKDQFGKQNHKFTATAPGQAVQADGDVREFNTGDTVIINSAGSLDYNLESIDIGTEVIIDYDGTTKPTKGAARGKEVHQFSLYTKAKAVSA